MYRNQEFNFAKSLSKKKKITISEALRIMKKDEDIYTASQKIKKEKASPFSKDGVNFDYVL